MFRHVFVAGTFDGLHKGHEAVLARAFIEGERVTVGLTPDEFVRKFKRQRVSGLMIKSFEERKKHLEHWIKEKGWWDKAQIIAIVDQYEPAASDSDVDALIVTHKNRVTGTIINKTREKRGLVPLALVEVPLVSAQDGKPISSTRIREGEIDAIGNLTMPDALRDQLGKPLGRILVGDAIAHSLLQHKGKVMIAVGDVTAKTMFEAGMVPTLAIVDLRVGRRPSKEVIKYISNLHRKVPSGPGFISKGAIKAIGRWGKRLEQNAAKKEVLIIDGEEDLLVLPVIIIAPLGAVVYYGQPGEGIVEVVVTKEKKGEVVELLKKFTS